MCGGNFTKPKNPEESKKTKTPTSSKTKPTVITMQPGKDSAESDANQVFSSPSRMKTSDLTEIYEVPSARFAHTEEVLHANGFVLGSELGKGSYATVYKAMRLRDKLPMACKILEISPNSSKSGPLAAKNELFILEQVEHPNIVKLYKHFIVDLKETKTRQVYIFMQLAAGESLSVYMRKKTTGLPEAVCKRLFAQMVSAVNHMHKKGIAHRDLKMGNILLDKDNNCLVTDFGLSRVAYRPSKGGTIMSSKYCGTVPYMAPEILLSRDYKAQYDPFIADIWALGVLLFCMVNRGYPFSDSGNMIETQMKHKIQFSKKVAFKPNEDLINLLYALLNPNMAQRIKMDELMVHPWIAKEVRDIERARLEKSDSEGSSDSSK